jgi:hypothetical protein
MSFLAEPCRKTDDLSLRPGRPVRAVRTAGPFFFKKRRVSAVKPRGITADTEHFSAILMERHAEHEPSSRGDCGGAVLDRLQAYDATRANETVASAEQHRIAEAEHDFTAA